MASQSAVPSASNGYENKLFHADIRIQSVEDDTPPHEGGAGTSALTHDLLAPEDHDESKRRSELQLWWDEAITRNLDLPEGYLKVAVLIIKWEDALDELETKAEALELKAVFENMFRYLTEIVELNLATKPQHQLHRHMTTFVEKHDGPHNLLIVYYTGHGIYDTNGDNNFLQLTASNHPTVRRDVSTDARADWDKAEHILRSNDVDADVFTILDTCYASNLSKSGMEDVRTYELLSACPFDATTTSPGDRSFTRALIDALKELVVEYNDRHFTSFILNQRINQNPIRRDSPSVLWYRLNHHSRHILLAPQKHAHEVVRKHSFPLPPRGYLTLRFALRQSSLTQQQIECLTKRLSKAFGNKALVGLRRIDFLDFKSVPTSPLRSAALALYACTQWKKVWHRKRAGKSSANDTALSTEPVASSPLKRTQNEPELECPPRKKGSLVISRTTANPPSPISDSS